MTQTLIVDATKMRAESVVRWLKDEHLNELSGEGGFYCNREIIRRAARESQMKCLVLDRSVIAFAVFSPVTIDIFEVRPGHRGQGHGKYFAGSIVDMLTTNGASKIHVECAPAASECFWRSLGFVAQEEKYQDWGRNVKLVLPRPIA